jgi:fructokinase
VITVAGEALMDLLVDVSGSVSAHPGGGPFNVARAIGRLGAECQFLGRISDDAFGRLLRRSLEQHRVRLAVPQTTSAPTTLALAQLDERGSADYRFYLDGTAAAQLTPAEVPAGVLRGSNAVAIGGLGVLAQPIASTLLDLLGDARPETTVLLDPNCRPRAIRDLAGYRGGVRAFLARAHVVKASVDDLSLIHPDASPEDAARELLALGPAAVLVTNGPAPVVIHTASGARLVPVPEVEVADSVGAGDAFVAGFLTWWSDRGLDRADAGDAQALTEATRAAIRVAGAACTVRSADLPEDFRWYGSEGR